MPLLETTAFVGPGSSPHGSPWRALAGGPELVRGEDTSGLHGVVARGSQLGAGIRATGHSTRRQDVYATVGTARIEAHREYETCTVAHDRISAERGMVRPGEGSGDITVLRCIFYGSSRDRRAKAFLHELAALGDTREPGSS